MVFHSVTSESQTPPPFPPPPPPPPPPLQQQPPAEITGAFPSKLHNLTFKWSLGNHHHNNPNRFRPNRLPLPEAGGLNPVLRLGSSPLNPARTNLLNINLNRSPPESERKPDEPVGPVEGSERRVEEKGKSKLFIRLPVKKREIFGFGSGSSAIPEPEPQPEPEPEPEPEPKAEAEGDGDGEAEGEGEGEGEGDGDGDFASEDDELSQSVKTWNLRPRRPVETKKAPANGGGSGQGSRTRNGSGSVRGAGQEKGKGKDKEKEKEKEKGMRKEKVEVKRAVFSLTLTKEEIEEDFLKMTGAKPPKKPQKRPRAVQKQLDATFPGLWLTTVTPDMYRVPDPPLKG